MQFALFSPESDHVQVVRQFGVMYAEWQRADLLNPQFRVSLRFHEDEEKLIGKITCERISESDLSAMEK
jgi:hypothetical protein